MAVGAWKLYNDTLLNLSNGVHQWASHTFKIILTDQLPLAADTKLSDIVEISGNGYVSGGEEVSPGWEQKNISDVLYKTTTAQWLATGTLSAKYAILYNFTNVDKKVVSHVELNIGGSHSVSAGEFFNVNASKNGLFLIDYTG